MVILQRYGQFSKVQRYHQISKLQGYIRSVEFRGTVRLVDFIYSNKSIKNGAQKPVEVISYIGFLWVQMTRYIDVLWVDVTPYNDNVDRDHSATSLYLRIPQQPLKEPWLGVTAIAGHGTSIYRKQDIFYVQNVEGSCKSWCSKITRQIYVNSESRVMCDIKIQSTTDHKRLACGKQCRNQQSDAVDPERMLDHFQKWSQAGRQAHGFYER